MAIRDLAKVSTEEVDPSAFEVISLTDGTTLTLIAESPATKLIWLEEIELAMFCIKSHDPYKNVGWQHEIVLSTIYSAAMMGDTAVLKKFINAKVNLDHPDESGMCPLHWACLFGRKECVVDLVEAGCELDCMNSGLNSPLLLASAMGHADITFFLIERGADVHVRNLRDMDCMFMCVLFGCTSTDLYDIIAVLQRRGVDINQMDSSGASPLHQCASSGNARPIQALADSGADVNMKHG
jgi:ankyrin repeat protein